MMRMRNVLRVGFCVDRLALGSLFGLGFCCRMFLMSGIAHGCGSVGFVGAL